MASYPTNCVDMVLGDMDSDSNTPTKRFKANADIKEGVSGQLPIDTTYEVVEAARQYGNFY